MNNLLICKGKSRNSCSFLAFLLFTFLLVAPTAAQTLKENNITLRVQNEPVENVFNKISEQTNFKFIYDQETVNNAPHVSCLLYTSPSPRDGLLSRMPSSA